LIRKLTLKFLRHSTYRHFLVFGCDSGLKFRQNWVDLNWALARVSHISNFGY
jgi:hypothetical protein